MLGLGNLLVEKIDSYMFDSIYEGYLYRNWACTRGERSKRIYCLAPAKNMKRNYMAFRTLDPEVTIYDLIEIHQ